ncbi:cubilin-like [Panonychus citri]|uniref:cubilin-like n=1 Tax=Panonychus citri TaxID=50023 RepID=UPI002306E8BD|nr:cubilin-like [Panonychus citri]
MASISNIIVLLAFNLLYSNLVQSSTYSKKLIFQQYNENPHSRQTNVTSKLSQKVDLFRDSVGRFSRTQSINKLEQDSCSCNSCLNGPSCRVENKIRSSRVYSDEDTEDDQSNVQCGEVLNSPNGIVTSPNYPNPFNVSGECLWKIKTSDGSRLVVNLIDLELDSSLNCTRNVLIVYDGPTDQDSQLLVACNQKQLADSLITSRGNELTIKLITNGSMNYFKGFKFYYETDCNNFIEDISGSIESPVYQNSKSLNCSWTIKVPKGNNISLVIEKFKSADSSCSSSYLSFIGNQSTKTFCQSVDYTDFDPILIADNQVQINFVHLNPGNQSYFRLEWKLVGCGGEIIESEGELVSPNYPDSYPNGLNCLWRLTGRPNQAIKISIDEYHIERNDSLQIFDGPNTRSHRLLNLSGRLHEPISLMTIRNQATISFGVDERFNGKGFKLSYQIHNNNYGCVNTFRTMKGSFASPGYPNRFARPSSCEYFPNMKTDTFQLQLKIWIFLGQLIVLTIM